MQKALLLAAAAAIAATLPAQAPCVSPAASTQTFRTLFDGTTFLGSPHVNDGANVFFDLTVNAPVTISRIGVNLLDNGTAVVNGVTLPNLIGQTTYMVVWTTPTTALGQIAVPAVWTQVAIGNLTVAAEDAPSNALFDGVGSATGPFTLNPGSYGIALQHIPIGATLPPNPWVTQTTAGTPIHPLYTNPAVLPTSTTFSDQFLTLSSAGLGAQAAPFTGGAAQPRVINTEIDYTVPANVGYSTAYGSGCYDRKASFYENFAAPGSIDLTTNLTLLNLGPNYQVIPGIGSFTAPVSPSLTLNPPAVTSTAAAPWDDAHSGPIALPASWVGGFPYPGGSTAVIDVGSNGYVFLQPGTSTLAFYGTTSGLLNDAARLCAAWGDWDPNTGGTLHYDVGPGDAFVAVTWLGVPEWNQAGTSVTFQLKLYPSGQVDYIYNGTVSMVAAEALVGWSPGGIAADPGNMDISATVPFQTGDGSVPAAVAMSARPVIGTTPSVVASNIQASATLSAILLSFVPSPGIPLTTFGVGAPGCSAWITPPAATLGIQIRALVPPGSTHPASFSIPPNPAYNGLQVYSQAAQLHPAGSVNSAGLTVSNALCIHVGSL
jgi:hypothetical protein